MFCPLYKNENVSTPFNWVVSTFGGKPLTDEEFRSADLRNMRDGLDNSSVQFAYYMYDKNNGNTVDYAPNGKPSGLFLDLLNITGSIELAIRIKSKTFLDELNGKKTNNVSLDINGEPFASSFMSHKDFNFGDPTLNAINQQYGIYRQLRYVLPELFFGKSIYELSKGNLVSSSVLIKHLIDSKNVPAINSILANILQKHDVPVIFLNLPIGKPMGIILKDGGSVIVIDYNQIRDLNTTDASTLFLHEMIHALTTDAIDSPKTTEELQFKKALTEIYNFFNDIIPESEYSRFNNITGAYILHDVYEFAAEFATNRDAKFLLYEKTIQLDKQNNGKARYYIKKFINTLSNLLFNRSIFKLKSDDFIKFKNQFENFLLHRAVVEKGNITDVQMYDAVYKTFNTHAYDDKLAYNARSEMFRFLESADIHYATLTDEQKQQAKKIGNELRSNIASALNSRIIAIKSTKALSEDLKIKYTQLSNVQISNLINSNLGIALALGSLYSITIPQMLEDISALRTKDDISESEYMFNMHNNFATYHNIFQTIIHALEDPNFKQYIKDEIESLPEILKNAATAGFLALTSQAGDAAYVAELGVGYMKNQLVKIVKRIANDICSDTGSEEISTWLDELSTVDHDTAAAVKLLGAKQNSRDITVRAIIRLINKANRKKVEETNLRINKILKLSEKLGSGEKLTDLYEKDSNGQYTSYLVRYLNYGDAYFKYKEFIKKINDLYDLPENTTKSPEDERVVEFKSLVNTESPHNGEKMSVHQAWNLHKNEYLAKHYERKYVPKYYEAYAALSEDTIEALSKIRDRINEIKIKLDSIEGGRDAKGNYIYSALSDEDWSILQGLYAERRELSSFTNFDGTKKDENSREYKIAKEILQLNETLYKTDKDYHDWDSWLKARNKKLAELLEKYDGDENKNLLVQYEITKWDFRNSRINFKKDESGNIKLWQQIDEEIQMTCGISKDELVFDIGDGGEEYRSNTQRINAILNLYRNNMGETELEFFPSSAKNIITKLEQRNKIIRTTAFLMGEKGRLLKIKYNKYKKAREAVYKKYVKFVITDQYLKKYGSRAEGQRLPRWATKTVVIYKPEEFVELSPGNGWTKTDDREDLLNQEFKRLQSVEGNENMSMIPKESLYKNPNFDKVKNSKPLKDLYDEVVKLMRDGNMNYFGDNRIDSYRLPQITGSMLRYSKAEGFSGVRKYVKEQVGFVGNGQGIKQDESYGTSISSVLDELNEFQAMVSSESDLSVKGVKGSSADGRQFSVVPIRYVSPLDDPSLISEDLVGILGDYYESSCNFKYKDLEKDKIESLIDMLADRKYVKPTSTGDQIQIEGKQTNTYQSARKAADMFLYSMLVNRMLIGGMEYSKVAKLAQHATTAINLGVNPAVAITGFFSSAFSHLVNSIVGDQNYELKDLINAVGICAGCAIKTGFGLTLISNRKSKNKVTLWMEYFNLVDQFSKKYHKSNQNRFQRTVSNNYTFGMLSATDFAIKSNIMTALLLSHHFYNGAFVSKDDIFPQLKSATEEEKNKILESWEKGTSLFKAVEIVDGEIKPKKEFKDAFEKSIDYIYERIIYVAEKADGVATETQKAEITTNFIGAAAMIHRQYLPLLWQDRVSSTVYNLDTRSYQQGSFNTVFYQLMFNFVRTAIIESAIMAKQSEDSSRFKEFLKSYKKQYRLWFSYKQEDGTLKQGADLKLAHAHRRHGKRILTEVAVGFALFLILMPLIFAGANDPDNKDELIYQFNAYIARRVQWEAMNAYNPSDALSNIRTLTAETSLLDKVESVILYGKKSLYDVFSSSDNLENELIYQSGVYKGENKFLISLFKLFSPAHNAYEQYLGSRAKRRYYENFVMKLDKSEQWLLPLSSSTEE